MTTDNVDPARAIAGEPDGEFKLVGKPFTEEPYGIGLKKGDTEFRKFINDTLEKAFDGRHAGTKPGTPPRARSAARRLPSRRRSTATDRLRRRWAGPAARRQPSPSSTDSRGGAVQFFIDNFDTLRERS